MYFCTIWLARLCQRCLRFLDEFFRGAVFIWVSIFVPVLFFSKKNFTTMTILTPRFFSLSLITKIRCLPCHIMSLTILFIWTLLITFEHGSNVSWYSSYENLPPHHFLHPSYYIYTHPVPRLFRTYFGPLTAHLTAHWRVNTQILIVNVNSLFRFNLNSHQLSVRHLIIFF